MAKDEFSFFFFFSENDVANLIKAHKIPSATIAAKILGGRGEGVKIPSSTARTLTFSLSSAVTNSRRYVTVRVLE